MDSMLNEKENECLSNCVEKLYITERLLKKYLPSKFSNLKEKDVQERLDNPTDSYGKYFTH